VTTTGRNWRALPALSILAIFGTLALAAPGDAPNLTYHANVAEVRLTFSATDQNGHAVSTLNERDFAVVDRDDVVRNFQSFTRAAWTNLELAMLLDASESVTPQFQQEISDVLSLFSHLDIIPDDAFSVISFQGAHPTLLCAGNCRASAINQLRNLPAGGATPLFDAIVFAADRTSTNPHARKVLILLSDGEDTISLHSPADAIAASLAHDIQIYAIDLNPPTHRSQGTAILRQLASSTGGRYFGPSTTANTLLEAVLADFHSAYTVSYKPPAHAPGFHPVRILPTHNLNLQFHCRSGYAYASSR